LRKRFGTKMKRGGVLNRAAMHSWEGTGSREMCFWGQKSGVLEKYNLRGRAKRRKKIAMGGKKHLGDKILTNRERKKKKGRVKGLLSRFWVKEDEGGDSHQRSFDGNLKAKSNLVVISREVTLTTCMTQQKRGRGGGC